MKTSTTYLNTTQLYISQPSRDQPPAPPPPPPRYPLHPPAIPPRGSPKCCLSNAMNHSNSNGTISPKPTGQTIYRSPIVSSRAQRNDLSDSQALERRFHSLSMENAKAEPSSDACRSCIATGHCRKCGDSLSSADDACEILGQIYHSACAVCVLCGRSVKNKHFFVKDQLYCEEDFLVGPCRRDLIFSNPTCFLF